MFQFTVREAKRFRELTGKSFMHFQKYLGVDYCQVHRLRFGTCAQCKKADTRHCDEHQLEFQACDDCQPAVVDAPEEMLAAVAFVLRAREGDPGDWEAFLDSADMDGIIQEIFVGNAESRELQTSSTRGSRPSSKRTRGSAAKRASNA